MKTVSEMLKKESVSVIFKDGTVKDMYWSDAYGGGYTKETEQQKNEKKRIERKIKIKSIFKDIDKKNEN